MRIVATIRNLVLVCLAMAGSVFGQSWQSMNGPNLGPPPRDTTFNLTNPLLLTDGSVIVEVASGECGSGKWYRLTPDAQGSYVNGTWSQIATMPANYTPYAFQSAVLPDGRVVAVGAEFNCAHGTFTPLGAIYDPLANTWTSIAPPAGWTQNGDVPGVVAPNGDFIIAHLGARDLARLDAKTLTWTTYPGTGDVAAFAAENGWTLLPDGTALTVLTFPNIGLPQTTTETLDLQSMVWTRRGDTAAVLTTDEIGPQILMTDGNVLVLGATGHTGIYHPSTFSWTAGPDLPNGRQANDNAGVLLPNGKVLLLVNGSSGPALLFDGTSFTASPVQPPPIFRDDATFDVPVLLPTGQVLVTNVIDTSIAIYTPDGTPQPAWAPVITNAPTFVTPGQTYTITGTQFNGLSQAVFYGDDFAAATNYPLVRLVNVMNGNVIYCRTHDHSTMAVATGILPVSTQVDIPATIPPGTYSLYVIANGIPSMAWSVTVCVPPQVTALTASPNVLWPPNHKMVSVNLSETISGGCGSVSCKVISVTSSEPVDADGDWTFSGLALSLRADRLGNGTGRIYTVTVECTDAAGKSSTKTVTVSVAHDQGH